MRIHVDQSCCRPCFARGNELQPFTHAAVSSLVRAAVAVVVVLLLLLWLLLSRHMLLFSHKHSIPAEHARVCMCACLFMCVASMITCLQASAAHPPPPPLHLFVISSHLPPRHMLPSCAHQPDTDQHTHHHTQHRAQQSRSGTCHRSTHTSTCATIRTHRIWTRACRIAGTGWRQRQDVVGRAEFVE